MIDLCRESLLKSRNDLAVERIDDELVILDKMHGQIHQLNATASIVWSSIAAGDCRRTIVDRLVEQFDVSSLTAAIDIDKAVNQFQDLRLLESRL